MRFGDIAANLLCQSEARIEDTMKLLCVSNQFKGT